MLPIAAIVITFQPEFELLQKSIFSLKNQGVLVAIIDNGSTPSLADWNSKQKLPADHVISLGENFGIAYAHNVGIEWAKTQRTEYVLLMDQDSIPLPEMISNLWYCAKEVANVGAMGPRYIDERQDNPPPFIQVKKLRLIRHKCKGDKEVVPVDYLISSGSLIPISTLNAVGGMREDLFIDYVDIEWGLRAKQKGFQSYGVCHAQMQHSLGDKPIRIFKRSIPIHSPLRHYYQFRNAVLLYRSPWLSLNWKIVDGTKLLLRYGFYILFAKPRLAQLKMMTVGLFHGLINRTGKY